MNLVGMIDDVRLYPRGFSASDVEQLFGADKPVFREAFDEKDNTWKDTSGYGAPVKCKYSKLGNTCPQRVAGMSGNAGKFSANSSLEVGPSSQLNLSGGKFTLSAWINADLGSCLSGKHTVFGDWLLSMNDYTYPTLALNDWKIGSWWWTWQGDDLLGPVDETNVSLPGSVWNHIAVTWDTDVDGQGTANSKYYLNGELAEAHALPKSSGVAPPGPTPGRSGSARRSRSPTSTASAASWTRSRSTTTS